MRLSKLTWAGIACLSLAVAIFGGWALWLLTRIGRPVYIPVPMTVGHIHIPEFRINLSGPYEIRVEAKKRIPFDTLNCLLGMPPLTQEKKCAMPPVVRANWVVTSHGVVVAKGTSDTEQGGAWANDTIERQIGSFQGQRNRRYALDIDFTGSGSSLLAATDPHLIVGITSDFYEGALWINFFLRWICSAFAIVGAVLLAASAIRAVHRRKQGQQPVVS